MGNWMLQTSCILLSVFLTVTMTCSCVGLYTSKMNLFILLYVVSFFAIRLFLKCEIKNEVLKTTLVLLPFFSLFQYFDETLKFVSLIVFLVYPCLLAFVIICFFLKRFRCCGKIFSKTVICRFAVSLFIALGIQLIKEILKLETSARILLCSEIYLGFVVPIICFACLLPLKKSDIR